MVRKTALWLIALAAGISLCSVALRAQQDPKTPTKPVINMSIASESDEVVAKVLGESITEKQLLNLIDQIASNQNPPLPPEQMQYRHTQFFREALDTMIGGILLKNEGKEKGVTADKAKVDEAMKAIRDRFPSEEAYQKALLAQGIKEADLVKSIEDRLVIQMVLAEANKGLPPVTDAEIKKFYDENPKYFAQPEQVRAAMIFLKVNTDATPEQKAEIKKKLEGIRADIEGKKITFAEAAGKYSEDKKTSASGGDLGYFKRGDLLEAIEKVAFGAKPGILTPVVETQFGYHLLSILDVKATGTAPLDDNIKASIKNYLDQKAGNDAGNKHIAELRAKTKIEILMTDEEWTKRYAGK